MNKKKRFASFFFLIIFTDPITAAAQFAMPAMEWFNRASSSLVTIYQNKKRGSYRMRVWLTCARNESYCK